jgi:hypothetical protein
VFEELSGFHSKQGHTKGVDSIQALVPSSNEERTRNEMGKNG